MLITGECKLRVQKCSLYYSVIFPLGLNFSKEKEKSFKRITLLNEF